MIQHRSRLVFLLLVFLQVVSVILLAQARSPILRSRGNDLVKINVISTSKSGDRLTEKPSVYFGQVTRENPDAKIKINSRVKYQTLFGFGGAFTESSAYVWSQMNSEKRNEIMEAYFNPKTGLNYTMGRVHMNSCDFSLNTYSSNDQVNDFSLTNFNIKRDEKYIIPFVQAAINVTKTYNPAKSINMYLTPWSPPAWMKNNNNMNGSSTPCLIDKQAVYTSWALFYSKFIKAYMQKGIDMWGLTIQNESEFAAPWEACVYTPEEQRDFLKKYLGPRMRRDFPNLKIMIFDHNRDSVAKWVKTFMADPEAAQYVSGTAFHWYHEEGYEHLTEANAIAPEKFLLSTESCVCPGVKLNDWSRGEAYGYDIINDLNHFAVGWVDWNLVLDMQGGPNHLSNFCDAPIIADAKTQTVHYQVMYYFMGHFSKYMLPGSVRLDLSIGQKSNRDLWATAVLTPANTIVVVVLNKSDQDYTVNLGDVAYGMEATVEIEARSVKTFTYTASK